MTRARFYIALALLLSSPIDAIGAESAPFDIKDGIDPVQLNQSGRILSSPSGISTSPDGAYLLVADPGNDEIKILDTGKLIQLSQFGQGELSGPEDISFDRKGRLLVADTKNNRIMIYKFDGVYRDGSPNIEYISSLSSGLSAPKGVAGDRDGRVYVANTGGNSLLLINDSGIVKQVTTAGPADTPLSSPHDVHINSRGHVLVSDTGNQRVLVFDAELNLMQVLSAETHGFMRPRRIASDESGLILIADDGHDLIGITGPDFKPRGRITTSSTSPGGLSGPHGVETIGRYMWVTDTGNNRVILYKRE